MFKKLKKIYKSITELNKSVETYKKDTVIQSLPTVAYVNKAKKLIEEQKYSQAKEILISALDISSQDSMVHKYLGKICENEKNFTQAVMYYETSSKLNPQDKEIWLRLGMSLLYSDQLGKAIYAFERADKVTPLNTDVYTGWGMVFMKQKKYALARDKFQVAASISKYNFTAILLASVMEIRLGEYNSAEEKLGFLVKVAPNESSLYEYAHLKLLQSRYDEALLYAQKTLDYNKKMLPAYFIFGEIYSINREKDKLEQIFKTAVENDLECPTLHFEWGKCYVRLLEFDKAREQFNFIIEKYPDSDDAKIGLALLNSYNNDFTLFDELYEKNQNNVYLQEACGYKFLNENKAKEAIDMFKKAINTDKHQTYAFYGAVLGYKILENNDKVKEYYEKFTQNNPGYLPGLLDYCKWLINVSNFDEAKIKLKKAQKLDNNNTSLLNMLFITLYTLVKKNVSEYNIKEAISIANRAIDLGRFDYYPEKQELETMLSGE